MASFFLLTLLTAFRFLNRNRLRSGLTTVGIIIGVGSVIAMVSIGEGAKSAIQAQVASMGAAAFVITAGPQTLRVPFPRTGDYGKFQTVQAGPLELAAPGRITLGVKPVRDGWQPVNLKSIKLTPVN